jgi:adenosylmethionine-8-amino-7-oxononanoate aminotransferase
MLIIPAVLAQMAAICRRHGVLFIADEVMTGWGRTGTFWPVNRRVAPDILCLAKGLTGGDSLAVTLASGEIYDSHYAPDRAKTFYHSSSYTANPIACAAAVANIAIWRDEPVRERIATLAARQATARPCCRRWTALPMCASAAPFWRWTMWWRARAISRACNRACWLSSANGAC